MPTYAQLQAETWWGREITTPELDWLGDELCRRTKRPRAAFGTKGDNNHLRGAHRSQEWLLKSRYATSRTYTVQSGLTATQQRHICGVDFNPGSESAMKAQSRRIIAAMKAGQLDEVREFFGTVDGKRVTGWNNAENREATSDSSHLWHWHLTLDRRHCANRKLMERILAIALGDPLEDDMPLTDADIERLLRYDPNQVGKGVQSPYGDPKNPTIAMGTALTNTLGAVEQTAQKVEELAQQVAALAARPDPGTVTITDDQLERALRKVVGSVDGVSPPATQQG